MKENYKNARTLATFNHLDETFRVVRRRFDGKHRRGYLMVLHGDTPITNDFLWETTDPQACATEALALLKRQFHKAAILGVGLSYIHA